MHNHFPTIALVFFSLAVCLSLSQSPRVALAFAFAQETAAKPAPTRRNIGLFFDKLRAGKTVSITYLGGTTAAGLDAKTPYRTHVANWLKQKYPQAKLNELNAAVAGTGALYGALRARRDVIAYKPDLVFLDLTQPESNDAPETEEAFKKAIEGVLRQLLIVPQPPEIVFLHTTNGQRNARVEWCEALAAFYQIPSLNLQNMTWKLIDAGQMKLSAFGKDGAQPNDEVHKVYGSVITDFLAAQAALTATPLVRTLVNPLVSDEMNYGEFKAIAEIKHGPLWKIEANNDRTLPASLLVSEKGSAEIELYFDGTVLGLTYQVGPNGGTFECLIDGKPAPPPLAKVDCYDATTRLQTRIIPGGLPQGEHKLTIRVTSEKNAKSTGNAVRLGSMLVGGQRPERL
jgi:hypothetical protein